MWTCRKDNTLWENIVCGRANILTNQNHVPLYWNMREIGKYSGKPPIFLSVNVTGINLYIRAEAVSGYHTHRNQHAEMRCSLPA